MALLTWNAAVAVAQVGTALGPRDGAGLPPTDLTRVAVGSPAPDFTLESKDGATVTLGWPTRSPGTAVRSRTSSSSPHPSTFVIDRQGVVRWKFVEVDDKIRASNEQILEALGRLR